ncbi:nucleic acid-binding, OB-fold protein [Artemisia annua]|uniref:Nucleic acid-binding, OB-fold protein n=1 Tax=Artemisia annua TaxID=35608 RepID=A0A2U1L7J5_ARTAN|nr:nucleic acid-binding, OB-fold protein [Artemisia annua]
MIKRLDEEHEALVETASVLVTTVQKLAQHQATIASRQASFPRQRPREDAKQDPPCYPDERKPTNSHRSRFTCEAWITSINTAREWYYISCDTCTNKVEDNAGTYECKIHGPVTSPHYRYNFKVYITDGIETAMVTCFTPKANYLIGTDCNTLVKSLKHPDPKEFPQKINEIIGKKHIFQFHFNTGLTEGKPNFILIEILDKEDTPKELEAKSSAAGQTGKATGHLQIIADPNASSSASETTPPPVTTPETSTNKMESESSEKKSAKRQLFQHKLDDRKKIKKEFAF